jgi:hypothetical protein
MELINSGSSATPIKLEDVNGNFVSCSQINTLINNKDVIKILINDKKN